MKLGKYSTAVVLAAGLSLSAFASTHVGVVNMKQLFTQSSQAKDLSTNLKKRFEKPRANLEKMAKSLQADIKKLQRNRSVMSKSDQEKLEASISKEGAAYHEAQVQYQKDAYMAQSSVMKAFLAKIKAASAMVAKKDGLTVVIPSTATLYVAKGADVTSQVQDALK